MLTLQELKQIVDVPYPGMKIPTAKKLKEYGTVIAKKSMGCETEILAFQNGYALYQVSRFTTVFPICFCGEYQYNAEQADCISEEFFNQREWYIRLVLEGEDRLSRNQDRKNRAGQSHTVMFRKNGECFRQKKSLHWRCWLAESL